MKKVAPVRTDIRIRIASSRMTRRIASAASGQGDLL
jgi:hypothetical protein